MNVRYAKVRQWSRPRQRQTGGITLFSGVLILILLTQMLIYAVQTGVFEQRKSANEVRQKHAFHIAESAVQAGKHFFAANAAYIAEPRNDFKPNGDDGWLSPDGLRWTLCSTADLSDATHPCNAENVANLRGDIYFYDFEDDDTTDDKLLPLNTASYSGENDQVEVYALLCMLDVDPDSDPVVQGCTTDPDIQNERFFLLTIAARGEADCAGGACTAEALISDRFASFEPSKGGEAGAAPLVTRSTFPPQGTAEIVANPNGAGLGVAVSAWLNANPACERGDVIDPDGGSWATCERHEWYESEEMPDDFACPSAQCSCGSNERKLSYSDGTTSVVKFDIIPDPLFPCDLFEYTFGVSRDDYQEIKDLTTVLPDCDSLDENSSGFYWVEGDCIVGANTQVGSPFAPVFLIAAGELTRFNGGAEFFGTLFVSDVEHANAEFQSNGTNTLYGIGIVDGTLGRYNGTFQIVYLGDDDGFEPEPSILAPVPGGWTDFHADWQ
jgi:hypothetical protein